MGEIIILILIFLTMLTTYCLYRMLEKRGLYFAMIILDILTFVLSFKIGYAYKVNINMSIIPLVGLLSIIYIFITKYGLKETKNLILITLYSNVILSLLIATMNYFIPAVTETVSINIEGTFEYNYKILIFHPIFIALSQFIIIKLYNLMKQIQENTMICIILTYIITGLLYTIIYYIIIYLNIMELKNNLFLGISSYILGIPLTLINLVLINNILNKKVTHE